MTKVLVLLLVTLLNVYMTEQAYFLQEDFIEKINEKVTTWKAGVNFNPKTPIKEFIKLLGSKGVQAAHKLNPKMYKSEDEAYVSQSDKIPSKFDARNKWKYCFTIGEIRDQGNCGSCWALATSSAFADRVCVATDGTLSNLLSAEELTFCCHLCGFGCNGGYPIKAWQYFKRHGIVTGGDYNSNEGCMPYRVPPCIRDEYGNNSCSGQPMEKNHRCTRMCYGDQNIDFDNDHKYTRDSYYLTYGAIQNDVLAYGPIEASFNVYDDFPSYKSGVYVKSENATLLGGHAVKLIGWGEEFGVPYWLMVNSWSEDWGDHGTFKIRRGTNECGVDNSTTAGVPVN